MIKKITNFIFILFSLSSIYAQSLISYSGSGNFELVERTDLRRYDNDKYTGLVSREISSYIIPTEIDNGYLYDGIFYILENTKRNARKITEELNNAISTTFKIDKNGQLQMIVDNGFPAFRSFPTYPDSKITIGCSWEGKAERAVDPLNKGIITKIPVFVHYTYVDDSTFYEEPVYVISASWATRYGFGTGTYYKDWGGDENLEKASGSHKATIYVSKKSGNAVLIRDNVDETFFYSDGNKVQYKGTISQFTKYPPAVDRLKILPILKHVANLSDEQIEKLENPVSIVEENTIKKSSFIDTDINNIKNDSAKWEQIAINENNTNNGAINIRVDNTAAGLRLTLENLQFLPDSDKLVPGQIGKLDEIAEVLKTVPNGHFLIEGHTASTGYEKGEMKLSLERAQSMAAEFISRGLEKNQFICKGSGSNKPVANNNTAEGKAKNRRVEITILE